MTDLGKKIHVINLFGFIFHNTSSITEKNPERYTFGKKLTALLKREKSYTNSVFVVVFIEYC